MMCAHTGIKPQIQPNQISFFVLSGLFVMHEVYWNLLALFYFYFLLRKEFSFWVRLSPSLMKSSWHTCMQEARVKSRLAYSSRSFQLTSLSTTPSLGHFITFTYKEINTLYICLPVTFTLFFTNRLFLPFFVLAIGETKPHKAEHRKKKSWGKRIFDPEAFLCFHFIHICIFFYDGKKEEQFTLPRIITPAFSCVDSGWQEGAFLQVISLDC